MALGTLTIIETAKSPEGPVFIDRVTLVGDASYVAGGTTGLLAALRAARGAPGLNIVSVRGEGDNGDLQPEYVHATDRLLIRDISSGADHGNDNLGAVTFGLVIISG